MQLTIHPEGWRFFGIFLGISLLMFWISPYLGILGFILSGWCLYFFRNPSRVTPHREGIVVSPADGVVVSIMEGVPPVDFGLGNKVRTRISVFLNVFDVHVNRIPLSGRVLKHLYNQGKFFNAALDKASDYNERLTLVIQHGPKVDYAVTQIAGLIARRIRCDVKEDRQVEMGQTYGLIRFGSRMDIWLPVGGQAEVLKGQRMIAGETIIGTFQPPKGE